MYSIHEVCQNPYYDRQLSPETLPLDVQGASGFGAAILEQFESVLNHM